MKQGIIIRNKRNKGWFYLDNEYLNGYARLSGASCTVVYLSLCRHADNETQECFPSMKTIAEENAISTRTVLRAIEILSNWNIIHVEKTKDEKGKQNNNVYTLLDKTEWKSKPSDSVSHGQPSDKNDTSRVTNETQTRVTPGLYKDTHINNTHITKLTHSKFSKPLVENISMYINEIGAEVDAEMFFDYYESNGWKVSGRPMVDWKAAVRNWNRRNLSKKKEKISVIYRNQVSSDHSWMLENYEYVDKEMVELRGEDWLAERKKQCEDYILKQTGKKLIW